MQTANSKLLQSIVEGDYVKFYYHPQGSHYRKEDAIYGEGIVSYCSSIVFIIDDYLTLYFTSIDEIEIIDNDIGI